MSEATVDVSDRTILIVDDSPMSLRLLTHMMTMHGYRAEAVSGGREALDYAYASPPDLVLLDIMMPDMDGYEVAERLKADERTRDIPIIFISALNDDQSKVKAFTAGGVDYVSKPLHVNEIVARVGTHLRLRTASQRLQRQLVEREELIVELDTLNDQLREEIDEREAAQAALQQALAETEALYRITRSLIASEDIPDMLLSVTESAAQVLPADRVTAVVVDPASEVVTAFAVGGPGAAAVEAPTFVEVMDGLTGWAIRHVQPIVSPKGQCDPRESPAARHRREITECGAILVAPLCFQDRMMGAMTAINRPDSPDFDQQDLAQLNAIAGQASVALANAQLSDETAYLKEFNEDIVQGVAEAILLLDVEGRITFANPAAVEMLGYTFEDLLGRPWADLVSAGPDRDAAIRLTTAGHEAPVATARFESVLLGSEGQQLPVLASIRPLYREEGVQGNLVALTDITEIKEAQEQLRRYASDLEVQNAELNAFAHTVAHDLRSPLTGIIGFADLLHAVVRRRQDVEIEDYVEYLLRNSLKMNNIIDELLLLASVREVDEVDVRPLNMAGIVTEAQRRLDFLIDEYGAEISAASGWPAAIGYAPWVEEVWVNYLSNAVKYGGRPDDAIPPRIHLGFDEANGDGQVKFWVVDNGAGLTSEQRKQLFTPFERLHNVRAEGHGLGLSIVRRILEKLGGKVGVESAPGEGSRFYFTLPRA